MGIFKRYQEYQKARNAAWEILLRCKVRELPVDPIKISRQLGIKVITYREAKELIVALNFSKFTEGNDGFAIMLRKRPVIFYDDESTTPERQRFTVAHELGHLVNGDLGDLPTCRNTEVAEGEPDKERSANIFAARLLAPACVLHALKVNTVEEIETLCKISRPAATFRLHRLQLLYKREEEFLRTRGYSCFGLSPLERQLEKQFLGYIRRQS
jgi:Zn-dependent peptidase ImmA (M78 family)